MNQVRYKLIASFNKIWNYYSEIGIHSKLSKRESRITRLINQFASAILILVIFSFVYQIAKHFLFSGEVKAHSFLMVATFSPYALVFLFNHFEKYALGRYTIIIYTLINNLIWTFTNVGQDANIYYANVILAIPIVIFFRGFKTQLFLILITFIFFCVSYYVDLENAGYIINSYTNPNFNIIAFGIWIVFSFLMMRFFLFEINGAESVLKKQNSELEDFTRLASHDMKEPLRTIVGFSSLLKNKHSKSLDAEAVEYLSFIDEGANRLNNLLDDLNIYNQLSTPDINTIEHVDLNVIIKNLIKDLQSIIEETNTIIEYTELPSYQIVPSHMRQIFQNLISNAIKFQPKDLDHMPIVKIDYELKDQYHQIQFTDNGIGIEKEHITSIFQKFKRLHSRTEYDGTGLGLATCQKIVELYHGNISIESSPNEGTCMSINLPVQI